MRHEIDIEPRIAAERRSRGLDAAIAALAERQHGVVAHAQLTAIGLTRHEIGDRIRAKRLHRLHRGVYAVGHRAVSRHGELLAAVLTGGPGAVLSHRAAAELWELRLGSGRLIDVTVGRDRRSQAGVRMHRAGLSGNEVTARRGIPVTTPQRTIIDLAGCASASELERAIRQAEYDHLTTAASLASCLSTYERRRGMKSLRQALGLSTDARGITKSKLERRFLALLRKHELPMPQLNVPIRLAERWIEADCLWPDQRLIVELDSRSAHDNHHSFESDRTRDRELLVAGFQSVRITWRHIHEDDQRIADDMLALLAPD